VSEGSSAEENDRTDVREPIGYAWNRFKRREVLAWSRNAQRDGRERRQRRHELQLEIARPRQHALLARRSGHGDVDARTRFFLRREIQHFARGCLGFVVAAAIAISGGSFDFDPHASVLFDAHDEAMDRSNPDQYSHCEAEPSSRALEEREHHRNECKGIGCGTATA